MENKNTGLKIMVIILCLLVIGLGGYIVYDKFVKEDNNDVINNEINNNENSDEQDIYEELDENTKSELKKVFRFVYDYYDTSNAYCGEYSNEYITTSKTPSNGFYASKQFTSYSEMINFLKKYMSEEVINGKNSIKKEYYVEKDGKLYCEDLGKGGNLYELSDIILQINNINDNSIRASVALELLYEEFDGVRYKDYENYKVVFSKENNNWIITSYEKQD